MTNLSDSLPFAALTVGQAKEMICGLISQELQQAVTPKEKPTPDTLCTEDAVQFLTDQGLPITKSTMYSHVFYKTIPFRKVGRRTVFSRKELLQWLENRTTRPETKSDAALRLSENARKR